MLSKVMYVVAFVAVAAGVGVACAGVAAGLMSCSPASNQQAVVQSQYTVEEGAHSVEVTKCFVDAKDGGTFESFCQCWNEKNAKYHVDAGVECKK